MEIDDILVEVRSQVRSEGDNSTVDYLPLHEESSDRGGNSSKLEREVIVVCCLLCSNKEVHLKIGIIKCLC